jgi:hypothetical protein
MRDSAGSDIFLCHVPKIAMAMSTAALLRRRGESKVNKRCVIYRGRI